MIVDWLPWNHTFGGNHNVGLTLFNGVDEPVLISLTAPYRAWRVGQNKPPDSPTAADAFFIHDETASLTRLLITDTGYVGLGTNSPVHPIPLASGARCTLAGVWTSVSDRNAKEQFTAIDSSAVLAKVSTLPISQWKYKVEPERVKHLGPTAQDFYAAFGVYG